ncbi:NAD-dependent epimerase/dehydratase family protein [Mesorhizobium marinum]|uniref:NAD-dependent epimerase/dehydratase family protein n=1 Tax=Mesorhizobium marinum TaxID=3228790 RepID=UPI003466F96F
MLVLVTGATGKVGSNLIATFLADGRWSGSRVRALCHNRLLTETDRLEMVRGTISERTDVEKSMDGVTHVVHLATCKETPEDVMDVTVKGLFWLLETFRGSPTAQQFILIGGDAAVGHFFYDHPGPVTESTPHMAYKGCYALSKVLEEVTLQQFCIQYGLNACCLRAPWIMEKDDFRYTLSFGDDIFGGPDWKTMVAPDVAAKCRAAGTVPLLREAGGAPLKRNFVHVDDLVSAILAALGNPTTRSKLYNVCMDEPIDYGEVAAYLARTRKLDSIDIASSYHSNWMDNSKAKFELGWRPRYDLSRLIDDAWDYQRRPDDPRKIWYPG